jgi:hypothetical protein
MKDLAWKKKKLQAVSVNTSDDPFENVFGDFDFP